MFACICGGIVEFIFVFGFFLVSIIGSIFGTNWYNKRIYKKFVEYKEKHKSCQCECHHGDEKSN